MSKDIVILGIQGCGKGTQAKILMEKLPNHLYFEMGQTLRSLTSNNNLIGNHIANTINHGNMVDVQVTYYLIDLALNITNKDSKFIMIDGFPREIAQAEFFYSTMQNLGRDFIVINMELSKEKSIERIMSRAGLEGRKDDNPEVIKTRIDLFFKNTIPVIEYFASKGKVININADDTIENIHNNLLKSLSL